VGNRSSSRSLSSHCKSPLPHFVDDSRGSSAGRFCWRREVAACQIGTKTNKRLFLHCRGIRGALFHFVPEFARASLAQGHGIKDELHHRTISHSLCFCTHHDEGRGIPPCAESRPKSLNYVRSMIRLQNPARSITFGHSPRCSAVLITRFNLLASTNSSL
jgi:hypothetical protein